MKKISSFCLCISSAFVITCSPRHIQQPVPVSEHGVVKRVTFEVASGDPMFPVLLEACRKLSWHAANTAEKTPLGGNYTLCGYPAAGVFQLEIKGIYSRRCFVWFDQSACTRLTVTFSVTATLGTFKEFTLQKIAENIIEASDFLPEETASVERRFLLFKGLGGKVLKNILYENISNCSYLRHLFDGLPGYQKIEKNAR